MEDLLFTLETLGELFFRENRSKLVVAINWKIETRQRNESRCTVNESEKSRIFCISKQTILLSKSGFWSSQNLTKYLSKLIT